MNIERYHPEVRAVREKWKRIRVLVEELEEKYPDFMITLPGESVAAKQERVTAFVASFINFTGYLIRSKPDAVYAKEIQREGMNTFQAEFLKKADRSGQSFEEMLHNEAAPSLAAYGTIFAVIDKPKGIAPNLEVELRSGLPYLAMINPFQVVDFHYGEDGELEWFQYAVDAPADRADPFAAKKAWKGKSGIATWTRTTFTIKNEGLKTDLVTPFEHNFGFVPVVIQGQHVDPNKTIGKSSFFASSMYLIMGNNLESASNSEVFKNAMATLLMQIQDWDDDVTEHEKNPDDNLKFLKHQASDQKNVLLYGNPDSKPEYLARDLDLITLAADRGKAYFQRALDNEKSALSVQTAALPQSGVSKAYDFVDVNDTLSSFAAAMERFERRALKLVALMTKGTDACQVVYPKTFDVRDYNARISFLEGLLKTKYPSQLGMREAYKALTPEITQNEKTAKAIDDEIDKAEATPAEPPPDPNPKPPEPAPEGAKE